MIREFSEISLQKRNSFGIDATAERLIEFDCVEDLCTIFGSSPPKRWMVLGAGNNSIFTKRYEGTILTPKADAITIVGQSEMSVTIRVEAGKDWDSLVEWAVERELWGIENLSLIPSSVGAAPIQNIGAYGCEVGDVIQSVEIFMPESLTTERLTREQCRFGYRDSIFKGELRQRGIIVAVTMVLSREPQPKTGYKDVEAEVALRGGATLRNIRDAICAIRLLKLPDPAEMGNAGSFFKNPVVASSLANELKERYPDMPTYPTDEHTMTKIAAGWLIEQAGMKGYALRGAGVHHKQALVLVNRGGATAEDVVELYCLIQLRVKSQFGIELQTEVNII